MVELKGQPATRRNSIAVFMMTNVAPVFSSNVTLIFREVWEVEVFLFLFLF